MEDPYRELREFVDPVTGGGPLDPKFRRQIGELLAFRDAYLKAWRTAIERGREAERRLVEAVDTLPAKEEE